MNALTFNVPSEISVVFHNGSDCHFHFIIKQLANELKDNFNNLGENIEKSTKLLLFQ